MPSRRSSRFWLADFRTTGIVRLITDTLAARSTRPRFLLPLLFGLATHTIFALAVGAMVGAMFFGMGRSLGQIPPPWSWAANLFLLLQFPLLHSFLLSKPGARFLALGTATGRTLSTTTYALLASLQLLALFVLWTPSGIVWWQASGATFWLWSVLYALPWLVLAKASFDAGIEVQSGALGWMSQAAQRAPRFPPLPTLGLFARIRHPIYLAFALTLWTVPTWTPDQLLVAVVLTLYCVLAPILKERRLRARHPEAFQAYAANTPYMLPKGRR